VDDPVPDRVGPDEALDRLGLLVADERELERRRARVDDEDVQSSTSLAA
jgi:hypothetical protein